MLRGGMPRWITGLSRERVRTDRVEKRAFFTNRWLGIALITPQLLLIFTFFYWSGLGAAETSGSASAISARSCPIRFTGTPL